MATNRLGMLQQMVQHNPGNTFARYGLAMEYASSGNPEQAIAEFRALIEQDENYAAAYYQGGRALEQLGRIPEARIFYEKGIDAATRKGDLHTRSEIQAALDVLPD
ncbi:MAG TPA: tetratricopeptide repeat protein [Bryobacteraceae bacterium]